MSDREGASQPRSGEERIERGAGDAGMSDREGASQPRSGEERIERGAGDAA